MPPINPTALALSIAVASCLATAAIAEPLNPFEFTPLHGGAITTIPSGNYTIDTDALVIRLTGGSVPLYTGVLSPDNNTAVFAFNGLTMGGIVTVVGHRPCAILSQANLSLSISLNASGSAGSPGGANHSGAGGTGNGGGGAGGTSGDEFPGQFGIGTRGEGIGGGAGSSGGAIAGGGGSFGTSSTGTGAGATYGNLLYRLDGGSGGGGGVTGGTGGGGGAGGGALELGAIGALSVPTTLALNGGAGGDGAAPAGSGGPGSGGGLLIHATLVNVGVVNAVGGTSGLTVGGGGRVVILSTNTPVTSDIHAGSLTSLRTGLSATNIDFGDVNLGAFSTHFLLVTNTGAAETSINGRIPPVTAPFTRGGSGNGNFSALHGGATIAIPYTFAPTSTGTFTQTITILSDAGSTAITLTGRGITPPAPVCVADLGMQGGLMGHDGQLDNNDFIAFINAFFNHTGCE